ncbi:MAG: fibronectin type III domain-containing protein [Candidatus Latescibacteria bacterium]|nr:fibronectin type III domain-containing protein [Candidatus Latescibacterota bacterium]
MYTLKYFQLFLIVVVSMLFYVNCSNTDTKQPDESILKKLPASSPYINNSDSLTLSWIKPDTNADLIDFYELFYRYDTLQSWVQFDTNIVATDTNRITLFRNRFSDTAKAFYFAVRAANSTGARSGYLSSTDSRSTSNKDPWYVIWGSRQK